MGNEIDGAIKRLTLKLPGNESNLSLRAAEEKDMSFLREWKNMQSEFFFFKEKISIEQQSAWYQGYQQRPADFMWIVQESEIAVGCMGIRQVDEVWDVYNVILGSPIHSRKGLMSRGLQAMISFATDRAALPITLKVLKHNPAVSWYKKNGFIVTSEKPDHFEMSFETKKYIEDAL